MSSMAKRLTQDEVIERFVAKHGDRYDYSLVEYKKTSEKVKVICRKHGEFGISPSNHLAGKGCPVCNGGSQLDTEKFKMKAIEVHGDRYDYSLTEYKHNKIKVKIICRDHGTFEMQPGNHLHGQNCPKCSKGYTNLEEFIIEANKVHKGKYDYSKSVYVDSLTKVTITCPIHGDFEQTPAHHIMGQGCKKCVYETRELRVSFEEFLLRALSKHGGKYQYDEGSYGGMKCKMRIVCDAHGEFYQSPTDHLGGTGCPSCADEIKGKWNKITHEEFINRCHKVHGHRYNYNKTEYVRSNRKVIITCKDHGDFEKKPNNHLQGSGCPMCASSGFKVNKHGWFYIIYTDNFIGFGITNNLKNRLGEHNRNFKKHKVKYHTFGTVFGYGNFILELENAVKKEFVDQIINTGIEGFRKEAMQKAAFIDFLNFVETYAKENRPEGRDVKLVYN